jgi:hypothetical protein
MLDPLVGIRSPLDGFPSPLAARRGGGRVTAAYAVNGFNPEFVADFKAGFYAKNGAKASGLLGGVRTGLATQIDRDGVRKWGLHNIWPNSGMVGGVSGSPGTAPTGQGQFTAGSPVVTYDTENDSIRILNASGSDRFQLTISGNTIPVVANAEYTIEILCDVAVSATIRDILSFINPVSGSSVAWTIDGEDAASAAEFPPVGDGQVLRAVLTTGATAGTAMPRVGCGLNGAIAGDLTIRNVRLYRSDLGGMVNNPDRDDNYLRTTGSAIYAMRRDHHIWKSSRWENAGVLVERVETENLLSGTGTLSTQSVTVTAVPHTLSFRGTGTVTLTGASTAGPLVGTGATEHDRVTLTFTPSAASLTLTVSGTVTDAQLEVGSVATSYTPNFAASGTATRATDPSTCFTAADLPYADGVTIAVEGHVTYADLGSASQFQLWKWQEAAGEYARVEVDTNSTDTGEIVFAQATGGTTDEVSKTANQMLAGYDVDFSVASRHGSGFINGAADGALLTANETPTAFADLSATNFEFGDNFVGCIGSVVIFGADVGDEGIHQFSEPAWLRPNALFDADFENGRFYWDGEKRPLSALTDDGTGYRLADPTWLDLDDATVEVDWKTHTAAASAYTLFSVREGGGNNATIATAFGSAEPRIEMLIDSTSDAFFPEFKINQTYGLARGRRRVVAAFKTGEDMRAVTDGFAVTDGQSMRDFPNLTGSSELTIGVNSWGTSVPYPSTIYRASFVQGAKASGQMKAAAISSNFAPVHFLGDSFLNGVSFGGGSGDPSLAEYVRISIDGQEYVAFSFDAVGGSSFTEQAARFALTPQYNSATLVIVDGGAADMNAATAETAIADIVGNLTHDRWLYVAGNPQYATGEPQRNVWDAMVAAVEAYGSADNFYNPLADMQAEGDGGATDNAAIADDLWPPSLLEGDLVHPNDAGRQVLGQLIAAALQERGWLPNA